MIFSCQCAVDYLRQFNGLDPSFVVFVTLLLEIARQPTCANY